MMAMGTNSAMRNPNAAHIDFRDLVGIIPENPKALPSNIDMVYERKGFFLVGEWKKPNEEMSRGQEILLMNMAKNAAFHVLIIHGDTDATGMHVKGFFRYTIDGRLLLAGNSLEDLKNFIQRWYNWANGY